MEAQELETILENKPNNSPEAKGSIDINTAGSLMYCIHDPWQPEYMCPMCNSGPYANGPLNQLLPGQSPWDPPGMMPFPQSSAPSFQTPKVDIPQVEPYKPINPELDGGLNIRFDKSTPHTIILTEDISPITNTYIHHDRGPGRVETNIFGRILKDLGVQNDE